MTIFDNRVMRRIFSPKGKEPVGDEEHRIMNRFTKY
jgi:hypothetical protein